MNNENTINWWSWSWRWRRWWWWAWGFRFIFMIMIIVTLLAWIYAPDPKTEDFLLILLIILLILSVISFIVLAFVGSKRRPSAEMLPRRERIQEIRRDRARQAGLLKYCVQCGKEIQANAYFCEFCGSKQTE